MNAPAGNRHEQALEQGFQLGELRIEPNSGEVSGPGGREKLDPKVMDVLVMLARGAPGMWSCAKTCWPVCGRARS